MGPLDPGMRSDLQRSGARGRAVGGSRDSPLTELNISIGGCGGGNTTANERWGIRLWVKRIAKLLGRGFASEPSRLLGQMEPSRLALRTAGFSCCRLEVRLGMISDGDR
jgi:hypothetical protein